MDERARAILSSRGLELDGVEAPDWGEVWAGAARAGRLGELDEWKGGLERELLGAGVVGAGELAERAACVAWRELAGRASRGLSGRRSKRSTNREAYREAEELASDTPVEVGAALGGLEPNIRWVVCHPRMTGRSSKAPSPPSPAAEALLMWAVSDRKAFFGMLVRQLQSHFSSEATEGELESAERKSLVELRRLSKQLLEENHVGGEAVSETVGNGGSGGPVERSE